MWVPHECYYHMFNKTDVNTCAAKLGINWIHHTGDSQIREVVSHVKFLNGSAASVTRYSKVSCGLARACAQRVLVNRCAAHDPRSASSPWTGLLTTCKCRTVSTTAWASGPRWISLGNVTFGRTTTPTWTAFTSQRATYAGAPCPALRTRYNTVLLQVSGFALPKALYWVAVEERRPSVFVMNTATAYASKHQVRVRLC